MTIKSYVSGLFAGILVLGAAFFVPVTSAQVAGSGFGTSGTAVAVPGYAVLPVQNWDRSDDAIVQLNNLTIQSVSGNMIYASRDTSGGCTLYRGACPMVAPTTLYQISVGGDTILLLRNRARASLDAFQTGDRVNVYGFLDQNSLLTQALIVRDLDKPSAQSGSYYTQFNNVRAVSAPSSAYPPAAFDVVFSPAPCALYSGAAGYRLPVACPYVPSSPSGVFMLAKHTVTVSNETVILDQYRHTMDLSAIQAGDTLNIFGRYNSQTGTIDALIVRDLSSNGTIGVGNGTVIVMVTDPSMVCIMAPCGLAPSVNVQIAGPQSQSAVTDSRGQAIFSGLPQGIYVITAYRSNGTSGTGKVSVNGDTQTVNVSLNASSSGNVQVLSPSGGETLLRGSQYTIRWSVPPVALGQISAGNSFDISAVKSTIGSDFIGRVQYSIAKNVFLDFGMTNGSYSWIVAQNQEGTNMPDGGNYTIQVCYAGTYTCVTSNQFSIGSSGVMQIPQISSVTPGSGTIGTTVSISGAGFTPTGNRVIFGQYQAASVDSPSGTSLVFTVPSYMGANCAANQYCPMYAVQTQPGIYNLHIENSNGSSNSVQFTVQGGATFSAPQIFSITPQSGFAGTLVTVNGSGFAASGNIVHFVNANTGLSAYLPNIYSSGSTLTFSAPSSSSIACEYATPRCYPADTVLPAGLYNVSVENANGTSNQAQFTLLQGIL